MNHCSIARRIFERQMGDSASRQEWIDKRAKENAAHIHSILLTDESTRIEVAQQMIGFMEGEMLAKVIKFFVPDIGLSAALARDLINEERDAAILRIADDSATKEAERMTYEDFLPD